MSQALQQFVSTVCVCGMKKITHHAFCLPCYRTLPRELRDDLWKRFGEGYAEAYDAALEYLGYKPLEIPE